MRAQTLAALLLFALASAAGALPAASPSKPIDCGRYTNMNQPATSAQQSKNRCFVTAFRNGVRAKLITVRATVEGDPITIYYRVLGVRRLEMIMDARRDRYGGSEDWFRSVCTALAAPMNYRQLHPTVCRKAALPPTLPPRWA